MDSNDFSLKRIDYISEDVRFCQKHWDWSIAHGKQLFVVEINQKPHSIAISTDSKTICSDEQYAIISYREPLSLKTGFQLLNFLEEERILSSFYISKEFHKKVINKICKNTIIDGSLCTCGAVKTYGINCLKQSFMHSDWCNVNKSSSC